jgi:hypothetical protein
MKNKNIRMNLDYLPHRFWSLDVVYTSLGKHWHCKLLIRVEPGGQRLALGDVKFLPKK